MINLYDYQTEAVSQVRSAMEKHYKHILVQSPTGSGKTVIFSHIVAEMKKKGKRALIITDRVELLFETGGTLQQFGLKPFHILAGQMVEPSMQYQVYVAMSQTLRRRIGMWPRFWKSFDLVIMDECHKQEFNPYFENNCFDCHVFGFSATPVRSGKMRQLSEDYEIMIEGLQVPELIKRGKLVKDNYYGVESVALDHAKYNSEGDYAENWLYERFNKTELYAGVVENWQKICPDTVTLVFCVNIQHTIQTCKAFNDAGIKAKFLVSDVSKPQLPEHATEGQIVRYERHLKEYETYVEAYGNYSGNRETVIRQWKDHKFEVLCNAGILTTGFNRRDIETIVVNRATVSVALWLQMIGRGSRPYPGKKFFNILDFGGNGARLGYYNQMRQWSLTHESKQGDGAVPVKECGKDNKADERGNTGCQAYVFVSADICPYCGYVFKKEKPEKFAELVEINYLEDITPINKLHAEFKKLERMAEDRGYKQAWVIPQIINKHGSEGLRQYSEYKGYLSGWYWQTKQRFANLIEKYEEKQREAVPA
jgi:superfamily II DNA or RNA helicase